jgi:hypothetical protein
VFGLAGEGVQIDDRLDDAAELAAGEDAPHALQGGVGELGEPGVHPVAQTGREVEGAVVVGGEAGVQQAAQDLVGGVVRGPDPGVVAAGHRLQLDELGLRVRREEAGVARSAPGAAQGGGETAAGGVGEGGTLGLVEGVRREIAGPGRGVGGAAALEAADLGGAQGARPDVESVEGAREHGVGGEVRAAEPGVGRGAEARRGERHGGVAGRGGAVDVERAGTVRDGHGEVAPPVQWKRRGAVDALFGAGPAGGEGEARDAVGIAGGQVHVAGGVVAEVEDPGPGPGVGGLDPDGEGDRGTGGEDTGRQVDVLVGAPYLLGRTAEPARGGQYGRVPAQRLADLDEGVHHGADLLRVHRVAGARVRLGEHGEEVAGVVAAQIAVGLPVQALPAAGGDRAFDGSPALARKTWSSRFTS